MEHEMKCTGCSRPVRPIVVLDIDGTLGDYHGHFTTFASSYVGYELPDQFDGMMEMHEYLGLDLSLYREIKLAYRQGGLKRTMPAHDGASDLSDQLASEHVEIWIATTRPYLRLDNIDPDTREWLRRNQITYDGLIYGEDKYRQLTQIVDPHRVVAVFDDLPAQIVEANRTGLPTVLRRARHNRYFAHDPSVNNLRQALDLAKTMLTDWEGSHG